MQILEVANLKPGQRFGLPLFHHTGRKLLAADTELSPGHLDAMRRIGALQVYLAQTAREVVDLAATPAKLIAVRDLRMGQIAETDLMTPDGAVIVQQNEQIEEHHLAALSDSQVEFLIPRTPVDAETVRTAIQDMARVAVNHVTAQLSRGAYLRAAEALDPFKRSLPAPTDEILNLNGVQLLRRRLSSRLQPIYGQLETGKTVQVQALEAIASDLLDLQRSEPRQFCQLAMCTHSREDFLPDHALSVAVLSMAIATQMNLSLEYIREVILGALLFDVGMLVIPKRVRISTGVLTAGDKQRVLEHPALTVSFMEQIKGLSAIPRVVGLQHHERLNGTGYPYNTMGDAISDFARIVTVADVFAAMIGHRPYKSPKLPYTAMEEIIHMAHRGQLDVRPVKGLLSAIGLFPIGSYVVLSNQKSARVIGANETRIDRPLITVLTGNSLTSDEVLDLCDPQCSTIKITKAIAPPASVAPKPAVAAVS